MKKSVTDLINFLLIIIFCTTRFWGINLPWYVNVIVRIISIVFLIISNNLIIKISKKAIKIMKYTIIPIVFIALYSYFIWVITGNFPKINVVTNLLSSSIYLIIDILFGVIIYSKYKEKSVDIFVNCGFISYIIGSIIPLLLYFSLEGIKYLFTAYSNNYELLYYTEVNDLTFGIGFCLLYYLFMDKKNMKKNIKNIIKCLLIIFWGLKRIEIFALVLCCLVYKFIISKINIRQSITIVTIIISLVSYLYVMFIHNSTLIDLANKYNINFMGRLPTYEYVSEKYSDFSLGFIGIGFGHIDEILQELVNEDFRIGYIPIISLHSDILRMYIGIGFIAFGMWIYYQCYIKTNLIRKYVDSNCAKLYLIFTIYLFILYLTDNTYSYPITFTLYFICTLCSITNETEKEQLDKGDVI